MSDEEHILQSNCVRYFWLQYPAYRYLLFAIPNGGFRNKATASRLRHEGVVAGVADLFLSLPNRDFHGLYIEMKTAKGRQQESQKLFQKAVEKHGYKYIICRSVEDFINSVSNYLQNM